MFATIPYGCGSGGDDIQTDWILAEEPDGDTLALTVAIGGSCNSFDRVDIDESEEQVVIQAYVNEESGDCTDDLRWQDHEIELDQPLGDRLLDGCDSPRPARDMGILPNCGDVLDPATGGPRPH